MRKHVQSEQIDRFRRGALAADEALFVGRHLAECKECAALYRNDPEALRELRDALTKDAGASAGSPLRYAAAAAMLLVIAAIAVFFLMRREEAPVAKSARIVHLPPPAILGELRPAPDMLRGEPDSLNAQLEPRGVVVESAQPPFKWPATAGATYVVSVFNGPALVAESAALDIPSWTPPGPLERGVNYTWQVEIRRGSSSAILPSPPAPPAVFRVLDQRAFDEIERVRSRYPNDHLRLGILYARAGMQERAVEELSASHDAAAPRLLHEVRSW